MRLNLNFNDGDDTDIYVLSFYLICIVLSSLSVVISTTMFVAQMSFFANISPKDIGGTYMTALNTLSNLGGMWSVP